MVPITPDLLPGVNVPNELTLMAIREAVRAPSPIKMQDIVDAVSNNKPTPVATLLRPFQASTTLWTITKSELFSVNTFAMRLNHPRHKPTTRQVQHLLLELRVFTWAQCSQFGLPSRPDSTDALNVAVTQHAALKTLVVSVHPYSRAAESTHFNNTVDDQTERGSLAYAEDMWVTLATMLRVVQQVDKPGVTKYVRVTQAVGLEEGAEAYGGIKFDARSMGFQQLLWAIMDHPRCEVRMP